MRWFKHLANSGSDEKLLDVFDEFGLEGYGFWWRILEIIALQMDETDKCEVTCSLQVWSEFCHTSTRKTLKLLQNFHKTGLILFETSGKSNNPKIKVKVCNMLKYRDEYTTRKKKIG